MTTNNISSSFSADNLSQFGPIQLVVIQPTSFCNLDCDYCYLPDRKAKNRLSLDLIEPIFQEIFTSPFLRSDFSICWHAGEPLAVPVSFYESAFNIIQETSRKFNHNSWQFYHSVQTNATTINQAWCELFKKHYVHVGVSLDGPAFIHDAHRKTRRGLGSHANTMRGISFLQKNDIYFNIIAVLTEDSLDYPDEMFNFFKDNGINDVAFNMEETEGVHQQSSLDKIGMEKRYRLFMERFWDLVSQSNQNNQEFKVREFETICGIIYDGDRLEHTDMNQPFAIVSIDYQGNFSTFDPELLAVKTEQYGDFIFGNILHDSFASVCQTEKFQKIYDDIVGGVSMCRNSCQYFGVCGGGAGSNKYWENGTFDSADTNACKYRIKVITDILLEKLENSLGIS